MAKKLKTILFVFLFCLLGAGGFYFFGNWKEAEANPDPSVIDSFTDETMIATTTNLVISTSTGQVILATLKENGESCSSGGECASGYCVDSVCCNTACPGPCRICSTGTCTNLAIDSQPTGCNGSCQYCDGSGTCKTMQWVETATRGCESYSSINNYCKPSRVGTYGWTSIAGLPCNYGVATSKYGTGPITCYQYQCQYIE